MRIERIAAAAALLLLPGCVVVPVPIYGDGSAIGAGVAIGALLGEALDQAAGPPPGAVWDPGLGAWRLP